MIIMAHYMGKLMWDINQYKLWIVDNKYDKNAQVFINDFLR